MSEKVGCGHPECQEIADAFEHAESLRDAFARIIDPLIRRMGPETTALILRGLADRVEQIAREAHRWNQGFYADLQRAREESERQHAKDLPS